MSHEVFLIFKTLFLLLRLVKSLAWQQYEALSDTLLLVISQQKPWKQCLKNERESGQKIAQKVSRIIWKVPFYETDLLEWDGIIVKKDILIVLSL